MTSSLAILGGSPTISKPFGRYNSIGKEEQAAAMKVIETGVLSQFLGTWHEDFYGGPKVREFERQCEEYFGVAHAVTVNSWTSGLIAALGAIGLEPGDEVIVPPWTMCASATAILHWNGIPVFADIDPLTFCLDPASVERNVSANTRAIMAVDIFGQSADMQALNAIASKYNLRLISDTAQAPGALYRGRFAGTHADIGGYSLNYHKHIHTGEGGILVTNDDALADRMRLIRNHAEAVVGGMGVSNLTNMVGYNFRLGEIECAIGIEQLKKLSHFVERRQQIASKLNAGLSRLPGIGVPYVPAESTHAYYIYAITLDVKELEISRAILLQALQAEGIAGLSGGYQNVHLLPIFQQKIAYGSRGFPWTSDICRRDVSYSKGICPVAEKLHEETYLGYAMCLHDLSDNDVQLIVDAFHKVWEHIDQLRKSES